MAKAARRKATPLSTEALWDFAVKVLAIRAHSTGELRRKLTQRAAQVADVEPTLARLREYGYLNDTRFAETYAGARLENQGLGKSRVLRDLRVRKVSESLAQRAIDQVYGKIDEIELINAFISRKIRTKAPLPEAFQDPKELASAYRKLIRAGFGSANVIQALKRIAKDQEALDGFEPPDESEPE